MKEVFCLSLMQRGKNKLIVNNLQEMKMDIGQKGILIFFKIFTIHTVPSSLCKQKNSGTMLEKLFIHIITQILKEQKQVHKIKHIHK